MINQIMDLVIAYPSFQLNTIIDPEQANINNQQIVQKINFVAKEFNKLTLPGSSGASKITILPFADVTATDIQNALQQIMAFIKAYITSNNISVADLYTKIGLNTADITAIKTKNTEQDARLTNIETLNTAQNTRLTNVETLNTAQDTRLTNVETKNTAQDTRLTTIETANTTLNANTRLTAIETKNTAQDTRLSALEPVVADNITRLNGLDVFTNNIQTQIDELSEVNADAELVNARTSNLYGTYPSLDARLEGGEARTDSLFQSVSNNSTIMETTITDMRGVVSKVGSLPSLTELNAGILTIPQGKGNAIQTDVLAGKTFTNNDGVEYTGTMPNRGNTTATIVTNGGTHTIEPGYHSGGGTITASMTNLSSGNVRTGVTVGGVAGTYTGLGNAPVANVLAGSTFSTATLSNATGTMVNQGTITATLSTNAQQYTVPAGYHSGTGKVTASITNLVASNVKIGAVVGGVSGTYSGVPAYAPSTVTIPAHGSVGFTNYMTYATSNWGIDRSVQVNVPSGAVVYTTVQTTYLAFQTYTCNPGTTAITVSPYSAIMFLNPSLASYSITNVKPESIACLRVS